jgi:hypothetical protein
LCIRLRTDRFNESKYIYKHINTKLMKKLFFPLVIFLFIVGNATGQEVNKKQWTLIHERTADWCPFCGSWGWDLKTKMINEFKGRPVVFTAIHHSGGLANPTSTALSANFSGAGQPRFYVNGTDINANSSNIATKLTDTKDEVDFNELSAPFAGIGINAVYSPLTKSVSIQAKVEVLEKIDNGDYTLGLYLLEDEVWMQANQGANALHTNVMKSSFFNNVFGQALFTGTKDKGAEFPVTATLNVDLSNKLDKVTVLGVIWNKVNGKYLFFNANEVNIALQSSADATNLDQAFNVYENEASDIIVDINVNSNLSYARLSLTDVQGRVITIKDLGAINQGSTIVNLKNPGAPSTYFVTLSTDTEKATKPVIVH